tara:strand:- start:1394 stop:2023 length:630 start_codon:yes stop_codon:yes gene_type:complete
MTNEIDNVFDSSTESSFFVENKSPKKENVFVPAVPGTYVGHIVDIKSNVYDVKGGEYKARIYNFYVQLAKENEGNKYKVEDKMVDGKEFIGRKLRSDGIFRYLEPGPNDSFKGRPDMNMGYLKFCEAIGLECKEVKKEIDGNEVTVKQLPSIVEEEILGKAVKVTTKYGRPYKNSKGFDTTPLVIKYFNIWEDGKDKTIEKTNLDEIPF